jgi:hypothetical protein
MRNNIHWILGLLLLFAAAGVYAQEPATGYPDNTGYPPDSTTAPEQAPMSKERIVGTVESIKDQTATIRTTSGQHVDVALGPQSYWRQNGYHLSTGMHVRIEGWRNENDDGPIFAGGIWGPDFYIQLTDDQGFPLWANSEEDYQGWYPTRSYFDVYFFSPPLYAFGPGPWWYFGPRYYRGGFGYGRHYYSRPWGGRGWGGGGWGGHGGWGGGGGWGGSPRGGGRRH